MAHADPERENLLNAAVASWMFGAAPQGILLTDAELRIVSWNHWLEEWTGRNSRDVAGQNLLELYPELAERGLHNYYASALAGQVSVLSQRLHGYLIRIPVVSDTTDFQYMQQRARISPLLHDGVVIGTLTIIDDVTERSVRETELQTQLEERSVLLAREKFAREEAEKATRLKDEFLATISHELRTPLSAIIGWANLLRAGHLDDATATRAVETIHRNARAQTQLIADLLDIARITSNKITLNRSNVELPTIIETALEDIEQDAQARGIRIESTIEADLPCVTGDAERLQQVIWNLLSNAIKFTPGGGIVHVVIRRAGEQVEISVRDSGIGIDPQFVPHVFDRFRQANAAISRNHGGLGLGLAIVRQLTELHGGSVAVHSEGENKGSTFTLRLPLGSARNEGAVTEARPKIPTEQAARTMRGLKVLVLDDEEDSREFVRAVLERYGSRVTTTSTATEALSALANDPPDFVISDLGMPDEDGYTFIAKMRALPSSDGGNIPAAALTAYTRDVDRIKVLGAGFQCHLQKPIEPGELVAAVAEVLIPDS